MLARQHKLHFNGNTTSAALPLEAAHPGVVCPQEGGKSLLMLGAKDTERALMQEMGLVAKGCLSSA